ncbi:MAG: hypothetical protein MK135_00280, partial [Polyangiaceae bacterium]|nr:hypothetical protein [Polyangiaceae bacterium]
DCQVNSTCTEVMSADDCEHSKCMSGAGLSCAPTDACVAAICLEDSSCCASYWDQTDCADRVEELCSVTCGAQSPSVCTHDACDIGEALARSCSADVQTVCDTPGFEDCCDGGAVDSWDQACIDEFTVVSTGIPLSGGTPAAGASLCDYAIVSGGGALNMNSSTVYRDVFASGNINGSGTVNGNAYATGSSAINPTVTGTKDNSLGAEPYTVPTWSDVVPNPSCPGVTSAAVAWEQTWWPVASTSTPGPGSFGRVTVKNSLSMPSGGGDYYVHTFTINSGQTLTLPTDGSPVNIFVCNGRFTMNSNSKIVSPTGDPLQLNVWVNGENITFNSTRWQTIEVDGIFTVVGGTGQVTAKPGTTVDGMLHNINSRVVVQNFATVDARGAASDRAACLARGVDPFSSAPPVCPVGASPASSGSVAESGVCVNDLDTNGDLSARPAGDCPDVDLSLDVPCDDQVPVCNRGDTQLNAGEAEIVFFPRTTAQFATTTPDTLYQSSSVCDVNLPIPAGECVDITCPVFAEDMTARVQMKSAASQQECNDLDNWSYYPFDRACGGSGSITVGETKVVTEIYQATCPDDSTVAWGFLGWNASLDGNATIDFGVRLATDGGFSGPITTVGTASAADSTEDCPYLTSCTVDVGTTIFPGGSTDQPAYLELTLTLTPDGADLATLEDWDLTYTCVVDQ